MKIVLNNEPKELPLPEISVQQLLKELNFTFPMIIVKLNGKLIKKEEYSVTVIRDGDTVEAIHLISGG